MGKPIYDFKLTAKKLHIREDSNIDLTTLQNRITQWEDLTFGKDNNSDVYWLIFKLSQEYRELCAAAANTENNGAQRMKEVSEELADMLIVMCSIADRFGIVLDSAVTSKFNAILERNYTYDEKDGKWKYA